jgi:hypothetical protein
MVSELDSS